MDEDGDGDDEDGEGDAAGGASSGWLSGGAGVMSRWLLQGATGPTEAKKEAGEGESAKKDGTTAKDPLKSPESTSGDPKNPLGSPESVVSLFGLFPSTQGCVEVFMA